MSTAIKSLLLLTRSDKGKKVLKGILITIFSPLIILMLIIMSLGSSMNDHNHDVIDVLFNKGSFEVSESIPEDFTEMINLLNTIFNDIDQEITSLENIRGRFDDTFMKSILLANALEDEDLSTLESFNTKGYVSIFYDKDIEEIEDEETKQMIEIEVIKPIQSTEESLLRAETFFNINMDLKKDAIHEIYYVALTGMNKELDQSAPIHELLADAYDKSEKTTYIGGEFGELFDDDWKISVTSEFGPREPVKLPDGTYTGNYHYGIDFSKPSGTSIYAPAPGEVVLVRHTKGVYGFHAVVDHGGGVFTLYAHMSRIHVKESDILTHENLIGEVGTTGASTGNHLHFEVIENRVRVNPRKYLN